MSTNKILDKINDAVEDAIRPIIAKGASMTAAELDVLTKAVCTIEKIKQIEDGGNSYDDYSRSRSNNSYDGNSFDEYLRNSYNSYDDGNSYRRGRSPITGRYVSRDAMPRFDGNTSRRFYDVDSRGYSGHSIKDRMVAQLEKMYDEAQSDHERQVVNDWIRRIDSDK